MVSTIVYYFKTSRTLKTGGIVMKRLLLVIGLILAPTLLLATIVSWHVPKEVTSPPDDELGEDLVGSSEMPGPWRK
jgi:hypothetical protein